MPENNEATRVPEQGIPAVERYDARNGLRIYRIRHQALPHLAGYVHLILGNDGFPPTLVDAGSGEGCSFPDILAGFDAVRKEWGESVTPERVETLIVSHAHIDHFGGAHLWKRYGARVCAHLYEARMLESFRERASVANAAYEEFLRRTGTPEDRIDSVLQAFGFLPGRAVPVSVDRRLEEGDRVNGLEILHFPGHSAGHIAVRAGEFLLSGDLILSKTLSQNWPESVFPNCGMTRSLESMKRLERLAVSDPQIRLLPAHESPIDRVLPRIQMIAKAEQRRNDRLISLLDDSEDGLTIDQLAKKMYLTAHLNRTFFAICDVASRVEYLALRGAVAAVNYDRLRLDGNVIRWRAAF